MIGMLRKEFSYGVVFMALLGMVGVLVFLMFTGSFASTVPVTVNSERAGLTMERSAVVKFRGVEVGKVADVVSTPKGARLDLLIARGKVKDVPSDVTAQIVPPTAFGAKYVQLTSLGNDTSHHLAAGDVITADRVTVEVNEAFSHLVEVLEAARPSEVNNAITALATALDTRGDKLGATVEQIDDYLTEFNDSLPDLDQDLKQVRSVVSTYDRALPAILEIARNTTVSSRTLAEQRSNLDNLLERAQTLSSTSDQLLTEITPDLTSTIALLDPVTRTLARYSPELPCLISGLAKTNKQAEAAVGGTNPGITTTTRVQPGDRAYSDPENLPLVGDTRGPACYGLPQITKADATAPMPTFVTGANPYAGGPKTAPEDLATTLFGLLAGVVNLG